MGEVALVVSDADDGLRERLDAEINAFNVAALSTHSFQAPGFYARFGYQECGRMPAYPRGYDQIHLVKQLR